MRVRKAAESGARTRAKRAPSRGTKESSLYDADRRIRGLMMGSPIPCFVIDREHRVRYWNRALAKLSGIPSADIIGTTKHWKAFYRTKRPCLADLLVDGKKTAIARWYKGKGHKSDLVENGFGATDFFPDLGPNGRWLHFTAAAIKDASGILRGAIETLEDITDLKTAEDALKKSEEKYRRLIEDLSEVVYSIDREGTITYISPRAEELTGYPADKIIGRNFEDFIHPDDLAPIRGSLKKTYAGEVFPYEYRVVAQDGRFIHVQTTSRPIMEEGRPVGLHGIMTDISERKKVEDELRISEQKYRGLFEHVFDGVYQSTREGVLLTANPALVGILGYGSREELLAINIAETYANPLDRITMITKLEQEGELRGYELVLKRKDGALVHVIQNAYIVKDEKGRVLYYEGTLTDVTALKRIEGQLKTKLREKEVLLKEINHRVKNNLQIVSSLLRLQSERVDQAEAKDVLRGSLGRIRAMALAHETLTQSEDLSRIDISDYIRRLATQLHVSYAEGREIVTIAVEGTGVYLDITQANPCGLLINELVTNALRHAFDPGQKGEVRVGIFRDSPGGGHRVVVRDTGRGFPSKIDFRKTETLGMQIVNGLVEQLDGTIDMTSEKGRGTEFTIRF